MVKRQRQPKKPTTVGALSGLFFGVFTLFMFATSARTGDPLGIGFGIFGLAMTIFCLSLFALGPKNEKGVSRPTRVGWVMLVLGATLLAVAPFVLNAVGVAWAESMGSGRRNLPLWALASLCWVGASGIFYAAARTAFQAVRRSSSS